MHNKTDDGVRGEKVMPEVSIVVPTFKRQADLMRLLKKLENQTLKDFEVIVVDSGKTNLDQYKKKCTYQLRREYVPNVGVNTARNKGITLSSAPVIAFTDDDCLPDDTWLEHGLEYFKDPKVVGVEGLIYSERKGDATHRTPQILERKDVVHGRTANMFYKKKILEEIGGFDDRFTVKISRGRLGYRGDTDVAWRMERYGSIPFAADACVFHPTDKTTLKKELLNSKSFIFSSLLLKKHPDRIKDIVRLTFFPVTPSVPLKVFWLTAGLTRDSSIFKKPYMKSKEMRILIDLLKNQHPKRCLEWGSGYSTRYFPRFLDDDAVWIAIEHDGHWYESMKNLVPSNVKIFNVPLNNFPWTDKYNDGSYEDLKDYVEFPRTLNMKFDFILVDGRARNACLKVALDVLDDDGVVVLHDANRRYYHSAFKSYKYQLLFTDTRKDSGGLWIGSNTIDVKKSIAFDDYQKKWNKQKIKAL